MLLFYNHNGSMTYSRKSVEEKPRLQAIFRMDSRIFCDTGQGILGCLTISLVTDFEDLTSLQNHPNLWFSIRQEYELWHALTSNPELTCISRHPIKQTDRPRQRRSRSQRFHNVSAFLLG